MQTATPYGTETTDGATAPAFSPGHRQTNPAVINPARLAALERAAPGFTALAAETRTAVDTATAAYHLNRQPQTLRGWACHEDGPLRPLRINGRLAWKTDDLRRVLGVA